MTNLAENITKVVLDVLKRGGDNYNIYVAVKAALAITPAVGGEDQFHPGKCLPDCMMPDGGECCPGYAALYDAYWHLVRAAPYATKVIEALDEQEALKSDRPSHSATHDLIRAIIEDDVSYDAAKNTWDTAKAATAIIAAFDGSAPDEPSPQKK